MRLLICGPDGSGKSVLAAGLAQRLGPVERVHYRRRLRARAASDTVVADPHRLPPRRLGGASAKLLAFAIEARLADWRRGRVPVTVVVERGWHDQIVDPRRYRLPGTAMPLVRALGWLQPRFDLAVVCSGDAGQIHARKPELGSDEIARQIAEWRHVAPTIARHVVEVDTVALTVDQALGAVLQSLSGIELRWRRLIVRPRRLKVTAITGPSGSQALRRLYSPEKRIIRCAFFGQTRTPRLNRRLSTDVAELLADAAASVGVVVIGGAVISSSRDGRLVACLHTDRGVLFVKIGPHDDEGLIREAAGLERLASAAESLVPHMVPGVTPDGAASRTSAHLVVATRDVEGAGVPSGSVLPGVLAAMRLASIGVTHGDLAPWNVRLVKDLVVLLDLESWKEGHEPFLDLARYLVAGGARLQGWDDGRIRESLREHSARLQDYASQCQVPTCWMGALSVVLASTDWELRAERRFASQLVAHFGDHSSCSLESHRSTC